MLSTRFTGAGHNGRTLESLAKDAMSVGRLVDEESLTGNEVVEIYDDAVGEAVAGYLARTVEEVNALRDQSKKVILYIDEYSPEIISSLRYVDGAIASEKINAAAHFFTLLKNYEVSFLCRPELSGSEVVKLNFGDKVTIDCANRKLYMGHVPLKNNFTKDMLVKEESLNSAVGDYVGSNSDYSTVSQLKFKTNLDYVSVDIGFDIGLMRTEHMVLGNKEQTEAFKKILLSDENLKENCYIFAKSLEDDLEQIITKNPDRKIRVRLLDLPANELFSSKGDLKAIKKIYGYARGVQMAQRRPEIYQAQAKAILNQIKKHPEAKGLEILVPTVRNVRELQFAHDIVEEVAEELGVDNNSYKFGSMIETLGACKDVENIVALCDFVNFGCNDLTSEIFDCPRGDRVRIEEVTRQNNSVNPFDIMSIKTKRVIMETNARIKKVKPEIDVCLCGDNIMVDEGLFWLQHNSKIDSVSIPPNLQMIYKSRVEYNSNLVSYIDGVKMLLEKSPNIGQKFRQAGFLPEINKD